MENYSSDSLLNNEMEKENSADKNKNSFKSFETKSYEIEDSEMDVDKNDIQNKTPQPSTSSDKDENEFDIEISDSNNSNQDKPSFGKYGKLPPNFDWRNVDGTNYDSPIRKQGECGSCYAISAISVMEARIRITSNNRLKPMLSPSSVLSCSRYNQGCFGGYPYLVGKFGKEFGFVEESCQPYTETDDKCFDFCFHEKRFKIKNFG